ncbi:MAG: DUF2723 domain-containing protein, partial [Chloroflexi bacterium]|nr:DUF2723 domain-containing protein [Chloroflexota bacterium]
MTDLRRSTTPYLLAGGLVGLSFGLAFSRTLYETWTTSFYWLGSPLAGAAAALIGGIGGWALVWWQSGQAPTQQNRLAWALWAFGPAALLWLHILAPAHDVNPLRGWVLVLGGVALAGLLSWQAGLASGRRWPLREAALVGSIALGAYLLTLQRTIGRADTFEFQVTAPVLGVAHPTGYPLYTLLGGVFSLLPIGEVFTRINLTSAIFAATAVALLFALLSGPLQLRRPVAAISALAIGLSPVLWGQAVIAEVYALHNLFVAALLLIALSLLNESGEGGWSVEPLRPWTLSEQPANAAALVIAQFALVGLSLTNHLTTVVILPALALALFWAWPRLPLKVWGFALGALLLALLIYLYIPLRWPALHDGTAMPFGEFIGWITGSRFSGALQLRAWIDDPGRYGILARLLRDQWGWPGVVLGSAGLLILLWRRPRSAVILLGAFAGVAFYGLNYLVPDIDAVSYTHL